MSLGPMPARHTQPVRVASATPPASASTTVLILVVVIAALWFGRDILIPFALSILLSFALTPIVVRLRRWHFGRVPAVLASVALVFVILSGFGYLVTTQLLHLASNLPRYEQNLRVKIREVSQAAPGGGVLERATDVLRDIGQEIDEAAQGEPEPGGAAGLGARSREPIPVEVHQPPAPPLQALQDIAGPLVAPLALAGLVLVFVIFILLKREDLRDRLIRLFGSGDVHRTTEAINDAAERISRYLLMQLVVNVLYGIPIGVGLYFIGVPNPLLWGLLATVLRFIPYVGPVIAAMLPIALSFAVDPGWTMPTLTIALFVLLELFTNNVLEPWLYGSSTGLSAVAIIIAAVFWTTLWGPIGLLLATPLTVCLVVLGHHVPQLRFLEVLLGSEPVLAPEVKFYQRMLAGDPDEAIEVAEDALGEKPVDELYGKVILPALAFAEQDRLRGALDRDRQRELAADMREVIAHFAADEEEPAAAPDASQTDAAPPGTVLCVGARNSLDEAAADMLADMLRRRGMRTAIVTADEVMPTAVGRLARDGVALVCLSYVNPAALQHARRLVRRMRQHFRGRAPVLVGLWNADPLPGQPQDALAAVGADLLAVSLRQAADLAAGTLQPAPPAETSPAAALPADGALADEAPAGLIPGEGGRVAVAPPAPAGRQAG